MTEHDVTDKAEALEPSVATTPRTPAPTADLARVERVPGWRPIAAVMLALYLVGFIGALAWWWDDVVAVASRYRWAWYGLFGLAVMLALLRLRAFFRDLAGERGFGSRAVAVLELWFILLLPAATLVVAQAGKGRALSRTDLAALRQDLAALPPTKVLLVGLQGDRESVRFAGLLKARVLEPLNWPVSGVWEDTLVGGAGEGILVRQTPACTNLQGARIVDALNRRNLSARLIKIPDLDCERLEIIVAARPQ